MAHAIRVRRAATLAGVATLVGLVLIPSPSHASASNDDKAGRDAGVPLTQALVESRLGDADPATRLATYLGLYAQDSFVQVVTTATGLDVSYVPGRATSQVVLDQVEAVRRSGVNVTVHEDAYSVEDLDRAITTINDLPQSSRQQFSQWTYDLALDKVVIEWASLPSPQLESQVEGLLGGMVSFVGAGTLPSHHFIARDGGRVGDLAVVPYDLLPTSLRYNDTSPFYDGDPLYGDSLHAHNGAPPLDSSGFFVKGNFSGNTFGITAGHATLSPLYTGTWYTGYRQQQVVGTTSTVFFADQGYDFLSIKNTASLPYVWGASDALYAVVGAITPQGTDVGGSAKVTVDGARTGEFRNNPVITTNKCIPIEFEDNITRTICHLQEARVPNGAQACNYGDSGGPVMQHTTANFNDVDAVGTIVACEDTFSGGVFLYQTVAYQRIADELAHATSSLIVTSP